ncbi:MAG: DUF4276 family protein [Treponema sp.]|jgi:hypothetical protein|nr:DUF4276 family protein [Treponema sp.]
MKKIALFVEGQTEQIFISELIHQLFTEHKTVIKTHQMRRLHHNISIETIITNEAKEYFIMIYDCGTDDKVKSDILDNYQKLQKADFNYIIGLQDFFNPKRQKIKMTVQQFKKGLNSGLDQAIFTELFLAVQEIEAWFIAEDEHYKNFFPNISLEIINSIAGVNVRTEDTEKIPHPSIVLDKIYKKCGRTSGYSKNKYIVRDIVNSLDFTNLYIHVRKRNSSLNTLLICLDSIIP